jgi:flagellin
MSISIQTNVSSLVAQQNLNVNNAFQSKTIQQLTSGYRINQAGDDAAGLAVANQFASGIAELTQGVANGNDGVAQLQIMDGGMSNISQILDRLQTLATQSASGTFTGNRSTLNTEFQNDLQEIDRQAQSIGLNSGGTFAQNLNVYLGEGSGSQSLSNGVVSLNLAGSAVDSQSLGLKGMEAVNLTTGSLNGTNAGTDLGVSSGASVQNIVNAGNQEATAGYAAFQFSGAGFSDTGKITASVNLSGVTDMATLVTAINNAIQAAGQGSTAAATAFQNAGIVASVHTDTQGGQELAFNSATSAFQVQAGDQMANALMGNVSLVTALGTAVASTAATTVTGANTTVGAGFSQNQVVKLVVTGGGLASPQTLTLNTGAGAVTTASAISALENQFAANAALQAAGLTMNGSAATVGASPLSFTSATGQAFNVQATGDTANLLGLGSFSAGNQGQADYATITGPAAYAAATTFGNADFEISLNGQASTALTAINLATGANALAASVTGTAVGSPAAINGFVGSGGDTVTITSGTAANPFATQSAITLTATQAATSGEQAGTLATGGITYGAALNGLILNLKVNNVAQTVTLAGGGADSSQAALLDDMNDQLGAFGAHAFFDANNGGLLTIASDSVGSGNNSSIQITGGSGLAALGFSATGQHSGTDASASLQDIAGQIQTALGANASVTVVGGNELKIASVNKGAGENFTISATAGAGANLGLTTGVAHTGTSSSTQDIVNNLNAQFAASSQWLAAGLQASATLANGTGSGNYVTVTSSNGTQFRLNALAGAGTANVGFGNSGVSFTGAAPTSTSTAMSALAAYGVSNTGPQTFTAMQYGNDKQALTFSAMDANGLLETKTITLANNALTNTAGANIDSAVAYINQQLQQSTGTPALQEIVAVKQKVGGAEEINFVSALNNFTVGVAGTANADGVNGGAATQIASAANGSGANMSIETQANAEAAVTAVGTAVSKLGTAQAAVGIGENQLNYAINLASSQITNYSAAESQIRDADVAQQAANLTKAQVLQQAAIAAMAQANSSPQAVLKLLQT